VIPRNVCSIQEGSASFLPVDSVLIWNLKTHQEGPRKVVRGEAVRLDASAAVEGTRSFIKLVLMSHIFAEFPLLCPFLEEGQICFLLLQYLLLHCWHSLKELTSEILMSGTRLS